MPLASVEGMERGNSFTFLRLVFALTVVFTHSFSLGGFGDDPLSRLTGGQMQMGNAAVLCFFVVSGFLITGSAMRQPSLWRFALNRAARILPGFWAVQLATVFALAPAIMLHRYGSQLGYWDTVVIGPNSAISYLFRDAGFRMLQYPITDLFLSNPGGSEVNGSLWSLAPEVTCYVYLGLLTAMGGLRFKFTGALLFVVVFALHAFGHNNPDAMIPVARVLEKGGIFSFHFPVFRCAFLAFLCGMTLCQFRDALSFRGSFALFALVALAGSCWGKCFDLVWPFTLPYLVLYLAHRLPFQRVERWGDFSYGIYIYAFPIQQCLALGGLYRLGVLPYLLCSMMLAVVAGFVSWRWLEQPVLQWARSIGRSSRTAPCFRALRDVPRMVEIA